MPSALRCPHPETSQKRPTQRMRGPFSRLTDSWVPPGTLVIALCGPRSHQKTSQISAEASQLCVGAGDRCGVGAIATATPDRSISSSSSIACTRLINRLVARIVVEGWPVAVADPEELPPRSQRCVIGRSAYVQPVPGHRWRPASRWMSAQVVVPPRTGRWRRGWQRQLRRGRHDRGGRESSQRQRQTAVVMSSQIAEPHEQPQ